MKGALRRDPTDNRGDRDLQRMVDLRIEDQWGTRGRDNIPCHVHRIIIGGSRGNFATTSRSYVQPEMRMNQAGCLAVVEILRMQVRKRRSRKAPQESNQSEDGDNPSHLSLTLARAGRESQAVSTSVPTSVLNA